MVWWQKGETVTLLQAGCQFTHHHQDPFGFAHFFVPLQFLRTFFDEAILID